MADLKVLMKALHERRYIHFMDSSGMERSGIVCRITWDDMEDICTIKTSTNDHITIPIEKLHVLRVGLRAT